MSAMDSSSKSFLESAFVASLSIKKFSESALHCDRWISSQLGEACLSTLTTLNERRCVLLFLVSIIIIHTGGPRFPGTKFIANQGVVWCILQVSSMWLASFPSAFG